MTARNPRQIRIAHVAVQLETGGMERLLVEFARHADRDRFELRFFALGSRGPVADDIEASGWPVTALEEPSGVRPSMVFRLARHFGSEQIDIVHTHNAKPLLYAGPAARLARVGGVVHTRHGQRNGVTRRQHAMSRLAVRCADRIVCVSEDSAELCHRDGTSASLLQTIWNGIDLDRFNFAGPAPSGPALYVGRLSPEKDVATLVRAAAIAVARQPSFRLQIAGAGPSTAELIGLSGSLGLSHHVEFLGEVRDVPGLLRRASLVVLPSITEGLPLTVLEAMACGLPVVATRVGGTPEALIEGVCGMLVAPGEPDELASAMLTLHDNPGLGAQMGRMGRQRAEEHFDVRMMMARYESLYEDVLQTALSKAG